MNSHEAIEGALHLSMTVIKTYISDLTDAELLTRPPGCHHLAFQLGHVISSTGDLVEMVSPGFAAELPAGFVEKHSKPNGDSDLPADFCTKDEYLALFERVNAAALRALKTQSDADLDRPGPSAFQPLFPTVGSVFLLIAAHPLMHAGQFVPVRRTLGKPILI